MKDLKCTDLVIVKGEDLFIAVKTSTIKLLKSKRRLDDDSSRFHKITCCYSRGI